MEDNKEIGKWWMSGVRNSCLQDCIWIWLSAFLKDYKAHKRKFYMKKGNLSNSIILMFLQTLFCFKRIEIRE